MTTKGKRVIIVLDEAYRGAGEHRFPGCALRFFDGTSITKSAFADLIYDADVLGFRSIPLFSFETEIFHRAQNLRFIQKSGSGTDWFDLSALSSCGILLAANTGFNSYAVAEHALMLMLLCLRHPRPSMEPLRHGEWSRGPGWPPSIQLHGRTVGIIGMGAIGSAVAKAVSGLGAQVVALQRRPEHEPSAHSGITWAPLDDLLSAADVLTLHVPLTSETGGLIGQRELSLMKPGAVLINTSRGRVLDESALYTALRDGRLRAAGLDVFEDEPTEPDNPLLSMVQVYATPHIAGYTAESNALQIEGTLSNIELFVAGKRPERLVNPEARDMCGP